MPEKSSLSVHANATPAVTLRRIAAPASGRRWEIDALRGLMLVLMTITHVPTRFTDPLGQPFGFVSAAEGFVTLSAYVAGMVYMQRHLRDGVEAMRAAFFSRALKIYLCQAALLVFLLGVVAVIGVMARQPAVTHLVSFFLEHPLTAVFSGLLLVYNPPLLDILPMYVVFMLISPLVLLLAARFGWRGVLLSSGAVWLGAQFGSSQAAYDALVRLTGMPVPFRETGAFDMLGWQLLWVCGLWVGASEARGEPVTAAPWPAWALRVAIVVAGVNFVWRHGVGQAPSVEHAWLIAAYDKWTLGPLRLLDFTALAMLAVHGSSWFVRHVPRRHVLEVLEVLGRQSLPVFCAHLVIAMVVLLMFGEAGPHRSWGTDSLVLGAAFAALYTVALAAAGIDRRTAVARARTKAHREQIGGRITGRIKGPRETPPKRPSSAAQDRSHAPWP